MQRLFHCWGASTAFWDGKKQRRRVGVSRCRPLTHGHSVRTGNWEVALCTCQYQVNLNPPCSPRIIHRTTLSSLDW